MSNRPTQEAPSSDAVAEPTDAVPTVGEVEDNYYQHLIDEGVPESRIEGLVGEGWTAFEIYQAEVEVGSIAPIQPALCSDCPPVGYPTNETRCAPCPLRTMKGDAK